MAYKYDRSEAFRAQIFLYGGGILCTPLSLEILSRLQNDTKAEINLFLIDIVLSALGFLMIVTSHDIMTKRDERSYE